MKRNNITIVSITYEQHQQLMALEQDHILLDGVRKMLPEVAIQGYQIWVGRKIYNTLPDYIKQILLM